MAASKNVPAYKLFIKDLINCQKKKNDWQISFSNAKNPVLLYRFQLQVSIVKLTGFNNEIMIVTDGTGKAKTTRGPNVPGDFSWLETGALCCIVGTLIDGGKLPHVDIIKLAPVDNPILEQFWPLEVTELRHFIAGTVSPRVESH